ncbi:MAG TPA: GrpB family protein [Ruminiclostridium sp.]
MIGLKSGIVKLSSYDNEWQVLFNAEKELIKKQIGEFVLDIQHVGSTSIPGLESKPIIDIAVGVHPLDIGLQCIEPLVSVGYEYKNDAGIPGRHFFAKGSKENRTHYLHIEVINGELWKNHILFRDYILMHKAFITKYANLKRELASIYENGRDSYTKGKDAFIKEVLYLAQIQQGI